ncbi:hypothetical protein NIES3974_42080 [Calothrix sp. NIES-3974]|nr:hypothetical protein NIES3974_42080 [Calothrix sp. NIES-3974]
MTVVSPVVDGGGAILPFQLSRVLADALRIVFLTKKTTRRRCQSTEVRF